MVWVQRPLSNILGCYYGHLAVIRTRPYIGNMESTITTVWPDLSKDRRAEEQAKIALGWKDLNFGAMTDAEKDVHVRALITRAQQIKSIL